MIKMLYKKTKYIKIIVKGLFVLFLIFLSSCGELLSNQDNIKSEHHVEKRIVIQGRIEIPENMVAQGFNSQGSRVLNSNQGSVELFLLSQEGLEISTGKTSPVQDGTFSFYDIQPKEVYIATYTNPARSGLSAKSVFVVDYHFSQFGEPVIPVDVQADIESDRIAKQVILHLKNQGFAGWDNKDFIDYIKTILDDIEAGEKVPVDQISTVLEAEQSGFIDTWLHKGILEHLGKTDGPISSEELTSITELNLHGKQIKNLKGLEQLTQLKKLYLSANLIQDITPLSSLTELEFLSLSNNDILDLSPLKNCLKLRELFLYKNNIVDLSPLKRLSELSTLYLSENNITNIDVLSYLEQLEVLALIGNNISNIAPLRQLSSLYFLSLNGMYYFSYPSVQNALNIN